MKQFTQDLGLYCRAVTTDIKTLKGLKECEVILHIPGKNHFVLLESIDENYVKVVDLSSNKFYYRTDVDFFPMDWTEGTALIISNDIIEGKFVEIEDDELVHITGAAGYDCNLLIQEYNVVFCTRIGGMCEGYYKEFFLRYGCGYAESGSCSYTKMLRYRKSLCIVNPNNPLACTVDGNWIFYYMRACN